MYNLCVIIRGIGFVPGDAIYFWLGENETFFFVEWDGVT